MSECAFCSNTADSKEHIWSDWFNRVLPHVDGYHFRQGIRDGTVRMFDAGNLNVKLPVVCQPCNNGWMSELEDKHAKPAMQRLITSNNGTIVPPQQLKSIANFAFKSSVIADHAALQELNNDPFFTFQQRSDFKESLIIPNNVQMWLGVLEKEGYGIFRAFYYPSPTQSNPRFEIYATTFGAGFLIFQVVACRWIGIGIPDHVPWVSQGNVWDKSTIPLWPNNGRSAFWPPDKHLTISQAMDFSVRWNQVEVPNLWLKPN